MLRKDGSLKGRGIGSWFLCSMSRFIKDVIEWDVANWSRALAFWAKRVKPASGMSCLELGARRGGLSLWLAKMGHRVVCSDITSPETKASLLHESYGVKGQITYEAIDATNMPYTNHFDVIVFKSLLGAVSRHDEGMKAIALEQIHKSLKPGGQLLFAENLHASSLHTLLRRKFVRWGQSWRYLRYDEVRPLFKSFSHVEFRTVGFLGAFGRREWQRQLLGFVDRVLDGATPRGWRYIVIGVAWK